MQEVKEYFEFMMNVFKNDGVVQYLELSFKALVVGFLVVIIGGYLINNRYFPKLKIILGLSLLITVVVLGMVSVISYDMGVNVLDPTFNLNDYIFDNLFQI